MRYLKLVSVFLLAWALYGCVSAIKLDQSERSAIKKIGVVALVNDFLTVDYVGLTVFNNKHFQLPMDPNVYLETINSTAETYLKSQGYNVNILDVSNDLRKEYDGEMSRDLEFKILGIAKKNDIDTIVILHDGWCHVASPSNRFGNRIGLRTSGHGLSRRVGMDAQQHVCITLDIVKINKFDKIVHSRIGLNKKFHDKYIIRKIKTKKDDYIFSAHDNKELIKSLSEQFRVVTQAVLKYSNL